MTTIINLEVGIRPIYYGKSILADEMYFDHPITQALATLDNPWDMESVINSLCMVSKPVLLTRQVNCLKYNHYDITGHITHREYTIEDNHLVEHIIESPFKNNFSEMSHKEVVMPDTFIEFELQNTTCLAH